MSTAYVSRAGWGARPPTGPLRPVPITERTEWYGHHLLVWSDDHRYCPAVMRQVQAQHQHQGWTDIGYSAVSCLHGTVYEGRGRDFVGAHCPGHNRSAVSVGYMGDGRRALSVPALEAVRWCWEEHSAAAGRLLPRFGHRDGSATECPGDLLYDWIRAGMPLPVPAQSHPHYDVSEDDVKVTTVSVHLDRNGNGWTAWDTGSPVRWCSASRQGPYPPTDLYWYEGASDSDPARVDSGPIPGAQPRGNSVVVSVEGGKPGGTVGVWVQAA